MRRSLKSGVLAIKMDRRYTGPFPINTNHARYMLYDFVNHNRFTCWQRDLVEANQHNTPDFIGMNKLIKQGRVNEVIVDPDKPDMPADFMRMFMNAGKNTAIVWAFEHAVAGKNNADVIARRIVIHTGKDLRVLVGSVA